VNKAGGPEPLGPTPLVVTVGEFSRRLHAVFRRVRAFEYLGVSGEISEWTPRQSGVYFTIKDVDAVLQCFAYNNHVRKFPTLNVGSAIVAYGAVRVVERRSRYELRADRVELTGVGALYQQYEALKQRFKELGFFDPSRKRPIPAFPRRVVLVSAQGKGAEDFLIILRERAPQVDVEFIETRVQGIGADVEIAQAMDRAARSAPDIIVLARGGGSYEDLFPFNSEPVVRAIVRSSTPVITGIGHTPDHHLADEVADLQCETPSNAAQFIVNLWQRGEERLARLELRLNREIRDVLARAVDRVDEAEEALSLIWERAVARRREALIAVERRLSAQSPAMRIARQSQRLSALHATLQSWPLHALPRWSRSVDKQSERFGALRELLFSRWTGALALAHSRLRSSDPRKPLEHGYAIVTLAGRTLREARDAVPGDEIAARLFHGVLAARVERIIENE
jgi:exodeoxyribonuclease VII large subunit